MIKILIVILSVVYFMVAVILWIITDFGDDA